MLSGVLKKGGLCCNGRLVPHCTHHTVIVSGAVTTVGRLESPQPEDWG